MVLRYYMLVVSFRSPNSATVLVRFALAGNVTAII